MTDAYVDYHVAGGFMLLALAADRKIRVRFAHDKKTKYGKTAYYEINGAHSSVIGVATVPTVAKVPFVANNQGIIATNVTIEGEYRRATPFQSTSCDKRDKRDDGDKRDSCDDSKPFADNAITELRRAIAINAKDWQEKHKCSINSSNLVEFVFFYSVSNMRYSIFVSMIFNL
jgi:hypothetical protein